DEVAQVDEDAERLAEDDDRLALVEPVDERDEPAADGEEPEGDGDDAALLALARHPLHDEAHGEEQLADEAERQPEVEVGDEDLVEVAADFARQRNDEHYFNSSAGAARRQRRMSHHTPQRSRMPTHRRSNSPELDCPVSRGRPTTSTSTTS